MVVVVAIARVLPVVVLVIVAREVLSVVAERRLCPVADTDTPMATVVNRMAAITAMASSNFVFVLN